ncbi:SpoIIAA family protein [Anatilimnocola floriformis]|uniref:STAS/SEC14 domain-containing protein n=1 Tax=Anatilimnocola floriformis TaxID=2948575 RepID=UPI0020C20687|nr:STAS/SEC14 domain-containing protein [Anatilimnocola floriformis]
MSHDVRVIAATDFLPTTVEGNIVFESSDQFLRQIAVACDQHDQHHVLFDATKLPEKSLSVIELYQLGSGLQQYGFGATHRIAIVCSPGESAQRGKFFELVAVNRGANVRSFDKVEEAWTWLGEATPPGNPTNTNARASAC